MKNEDDVPTSCSLLATRCVTMIEVNYPGFPDLNSRVQDPGSSSNSRSDPDLPRSDDIILTVDSSYQCCEDRRVHRGAMRVSITTQISPATSAVSRIFSFMLSSDIDR